jgi:hypothetical protein
MKVFFFDVDGTILDASKNIFKPSEKTRLAIGELKRAGYKIILATGRPKCILTKELKSLCFDGFITSNGADVTIGDLRIFEFTVNKKLVDTLLENQKKYHYEVIFESDKYLHGMDSDTGEFNNLINKYKLPREYIINDFNYDLYKAQILFNRDEFKQEYFDEVSCLIGDDHLLPYENYYYDVYNENLNKGLGVKKVKEFYDLNEEDYYAFGDGMNDYEMMENIYHSVCMNNGEDKLKKICRHITKEVENEGVYYFLKENNII